MNNDIIGLRIVTQNALIGKITKEVRGVYVRINENCISIYIVIDGDISTYWNEEIYELVQILFLILVRIILLMRI